MSKARIWFRRGVVILLAAVGGIALLSTARADVVDDFKNNKKVAAQKLEQEIKDAVLTVQKLKAKSPADALKLLEEYKNVLEEDTLLAKDVRGELLAVVNTQIKALQPAADAPPKTGNTPPAKKKTKEEEQREMYEKQGYGSGKTTPGGPGKVYGDFIKDVKGNLKDYQDTKNQTAKTSTDLLKPDIGVVPSDGSGVAFSPKWKDLTELRKKINLSKLTEEERALIKAMNSVLSPNYVKQPFQEVIKDLQERTGRSIVIDPNAMKALEIEYNTPVTFQAKKVTFRTTLKKILGEVGLAYILKDGVVQVVTPQVAQNTMTTQSYYIGDLIPPAPPGTGPYFNQAREQWYANQVMQMIVMTVEPQSWQANGNGPGTIWYNSAAKSIVIRNSAEMHLSLKSSFSGYSGGGIGLSGD